MNHRNLYSIEHPFGFCLAPCRLVLADLYPCAYIGWVLRAAPQYPPRPSTHTTPREPRPSVVVDLVRNQRAVHCSQGPVVRCAARPRACVGHPRAPPCGRVGGGRGVAGGCTQEPCIHKCSKMCVGAHFHTLLHIAEQNRRTFPYF